jgi:alpha-galactosidase
MRPSLSRPLPKAVTALLLAVAPLGWHKAGASEPAATHETRDLLGWTVRVNKALLASAPEATATAISLLKEQLAEVVRVVPPAAVAKLRETPLWFSPEYPGVPPRAEFHPDAGWLRNHGRDPAMARAIEFTNIRIFPQECERMPNFALHELAHAYHFRVLGFDDPAIKDAFERARAAGLYDKVEQHHGNGRPNSVGRAYAMTDEKEYFAEATEAFFSRNDFFPFTRVELQAHDPRMLRVLETAWGVAPAAAAASKPIRVYILAGQSNMEGHGEVAARPNRNGGRGSLAFLAGDPDTAATFGPLRDTSGTWLERSDVWIDYLDRSGRLGVGYGARPELIGPELGFGTVVGDAHDEPVLLVKCAWGGKSLAIDFRPPSAGQPGYPLGEKRAAEIAAHPEILGHFYREMLALVKRARGKLAAGELVADAAARGHVLAGFAWHQGWNDRIDDRFNAEYATNMAAFIRDVRRDLDAPDLPFVIAETGMTGPDEKHPRALALMKAQASVAALPEFAGTVGFVPTREFWRPAEESPADQGYHWNRNAETYWLIGTGLGRAMLALEQDRAAK